jgi:L-fucose isomerase-like protein
MRKTLPTVGFVGFGEVNSPKQLIEDKCGEALEELKSLDIEVLTTRVVTDDPQRDDAIRATKELKQKPFDVLVVCLAGWIPSHTVIRVAEAFSHKPMVLWGLAGDRKDGRIVTAAPQAGTTALRKVFEDLGYRFLYVYNIIGKPPPLDRIESFIRAAATERALKGANVGMMGFRDMGLYDTLYDGLSLKSSLGVDVDFFEMLEMVQLSEEVEPRRVEEVLQKIKKQWKFEEPVEDNFLRQGISYYLAIKEIVEKNSFEAISLKDVDGMKGLLGFPPAMIFMLLSDEMGLCTIPENDVLGALTQLIVKGISGQCAAYFEFYEFFEQSVLMGVPDYVPGEVVNGKPKVTQAAFGESGGGLLNVSTVKTGQLTMARLASAGDRYTMQLAAGEGKLRAWEEAGWEQPAPQLPSLEVFLNAPMEKFTRNVASQHTIIAYGDHRQALSDFCRLKGIEVV